MQGRAKMVDNSKAIIVLFNQDLRLADNPALTHACISGHPIIPLYVLDDETPGKWKMGGASRWWLHSSLESLDRSLKKKGSRLILRKGKTFEIITELLEKHNIEALYWNRCYEPYNIQIRQKLKKFPIITQSFNGSLLFEPWEIVTKENQPYKVFTPFWKKCMEVQSIETPLPAPSLIPTKMIDSETLDSLELLPLKPDWASGLRKAWNIGEKAAEEKLNEFINQTMRSYEHDRDIPSIDGTSLLSPHLHFGEISPRQIFNKTKNNPISDKFLSEVGWREFSYYQLYHFPTLPDHPWRTEFANFPWEVNADYLEKWQKGQTGYPLIDAGMRQLWSTGYMHNRVRMICASFLVKDLFVPWQIGAQWFWDTLVDADLASNSASWQWVAGCGFDAAPFFRIFNPILQSEKFDPDGIYIKRWVPELADVPKKMIHNPWKLQTDFKLNYPKPVVDHALCRKHALEAFKKLNLKTAVQYDQ